MNDILVEEEIRQVDAIRINLVQDKHFAFRLIFYPSHVLGIEIIFYGNIAIPQDMCVPIKAFAFESIGHYSAVFNANDVPVSSLLESLDDTFQLPGCGISALETACARKCCP